MREKPILFSLPDRRKGKEKGLVEVPGLKKEGMEGVRLKFLA